MRQNHSQAQQRSVPIRLAIIGSVILGLAACHNPQPPTHLSPPEVTVSKPAQRDIVDWVEFTGRMAAINFVKITLRVSGYIVNIPFSEGDIVHKGDLLFQIDPRPFNTRTSRRSVSYSRRKRTSSFRKSHSPVNKD